MPKKRLTRAKPPSSLRQRAEKAPRVNRAEITRMPPEEIQRLVHECQVHQIELEMQNEELRHAQSEISQSRDRFNDLYDFAPVGYLTLDEHGTVLEANLTVAEMLGIERAKLVGRKFARFVAHAAQDALSLHLRALLDGDAKKVCELLLRRADGTQVFARMESIASADPSTRARCCRSAIIDITERQQAEAELRASEARYRALHETMRDAFVSVDMQGRILEYNAAYEKMLGYTPTELRTRTYVQLTPKKWRAMEAAAVAEQILPLGYSGVYEKEYRRKDGTVFPVELRTFLIRDADGQPAAMWAIVRDITERKEAAELQARFSAELEQQVAERTAALRESERTARAVVDGLSAHIALVDESGRIIAVNERWRKFARENEGTLISGCEGANYLKVCGAAARKKSPEAVAVAAGICDVLAGRRRDFVAEYPSHSPREQRWFIVRVTPFPGEGPPRVVIAHENITPRMLAERALRESEERLRAILNTVGDAVVTIDRRGTITGVNPACARIFGYLEAEMLGKNLSALMPSPYREEHDQYIENRRRAGLVRITGIGREVRARRKDGTEFPVELTVSDVEHLHMFTGVIRDLSRRKELEAEVLRIGEEERRRMAADLHDGICQEMVGIQYLAILLLRDLEKAHHPLAAQARRIEEAIIKTTAHSRQLARGLSPVVADGSGLMHALRQLAETTSEARRIHCAFECPTPVTIENPTTANELYRIAQEAIHNAVRHARAKRITVRLTQTNGAACLTVADNGPGLPADVESAPGMGLRVMRYRASLIGGQLVIQPRRSGGTEVICRWEREGSKA